MKLPKRIDEMTLSELVQALDQLLPMSKPSWIQCRVGFQVGQLADAGVISKMFGKACARKYGSADGITVEVGVDETLTDDVVVDRVE